MSNEKISQNKAIKISSKAFIVDTASTSSKKLKKPKFTARPKKPELSVVNVIEQISQMLRKEIHSIERKRVSGE